MKKILAMAAVAALAAGASAFAANPFSDVSTSDWAYQAISDLSDRGLVEGYPDGTFKGQQNITRYEVAQIIARLMAKEDQMNAEDRAIIDRLAGEYGAELENLGVRVSNLEKKVGNIVWTGDARMRYQKAMGGNDKFNGRIRLNARANVNDTTYVHGRLVANGDFKNSDGGDVTMDRIYVHHQFGIVGAKLGRYELDMGQQVGGWLYSEKFDGVELAAPIGQKVNLAIGYGRMNGSKVTIPEDTAKNIKKHDASDFYKAEAFYAQAKANLGVVKLGVDYYRTSSFAYYDDQAVLSTDKNKKSVWGVNLLVPVNKFRVFGDYYADTKANLGYKDAQNPEGQKGKIWTVGLGYGKMDLKKAGSFNLDLAYFKVKGGLYEGGTGLQLSTANDLLAMRDGRFWLVTGDVAVAQNTYVHGEYAFSSKEEKTEKGYNGWTLSLNYKF
jgi:hypothetical protein